MRPTHLAALAAAAACVLAVALLRPRVVSSDLRGADLTGARLPGADLQKARLRGVNLDRANLPKANLSQADLGEANLSRADLGLSSLRKARLQGANLDRANLGSADLREADLSGANLRGANLEGADLRGATLQGAASDARTSWPKGFDPSLAGVNVARETLRPGRKPLPEAAESLEPQDTPRPLETPIPSPEPGRLLGDPNRLDTAPGPPQDRTLGELQPAAPAAPLEAP